MNFRYQKNLNKTVSNYQAIWKRDWSFMVAIVVYLMLTLGCRHAVKSSSITSVSRTHSDWKPVYEATESVSPLSIDEVLSHPEDHIDRNVTIIGVVDELQLKKNSKGFRILGIDLRDTNNTIPVENVKENIIRLNVLEQLNSIGELLVQSAQDIELSSLEVTVFEDLSYDLKINGNRIRALGNFFRSKEKLKVGDDLELIADGFLKLGDAFYSFSNLAAEYELEASIEQVDILPNINVQKNDTNDFQDTIKTVCNELSDLANTLIENRSQLLSGNLVIGHNNSSNSQGYALLSIGDMFEAKRWESKKSHAEISEHQFDVLSSGFNLVGLGVKDIYSGYRELGKGVTLKAGGTVTRKIDAYPTLKCAYIGYNKFVLNDCESKVKQLGENGVVTVRGRLVRGNLHEQLNLLWLKMESVTVDNLTIDLAHNETSPTWRNLTNLYDWVKETTN